MRKITMNGQPIKFERGVPLTGPATTGRGRRKSDVRQVLEVMKDGESALLPTTSKRMQSLNLYGIAKAVGALFRYRAEGDGVRVWRFSASPKLSIVPQRKAASGR